MDDGSEITSCAECGGAVAPKDHGGRRKWFRGAEVVYPPGVLIPTCARCGATWMDDALVEVVYGAFSHQITAQRRGATGT